jgi:hypothetical protein
MKRHLFDTLQNITTTTATTTNNNNNNDYDDNNGWSIKLTTLLYLMQG